MQEQVEQQGMVGGSGGIGGVVDEYSGERIKVEIATHPLYEQLLSAHVACLRVATPIDQLPLIDAQLSHSHLLLRSYASQHNHLHLHPAHRQDLHNFLVRSGSIKFYYINICTIKIAPEDWVNNYMGYCRHNT